MDDRRRGFVERLFEEHGRHVIAYFYKRLRIKSAAPDLVQEVFARLATVKDPDAIRDPERYLWIVTRNVYREYRAKEGREVPLPDFNDSDAHRALGHLPSVDGEVEGDQILALLDSAIANLPPKIRTAMILKYRHEFTYQEIAEVMGVGASMVKKYLAMGLALCRLSMGPNL
jgi:RNA polymerase sigma-70 factor (ECF subfamily)